MDLSSMPLAENDDTVITNNGFYPNVVVGELTKSLAIETPYANNTALLHSSIELAISDVNNELATHRAHAWDGYTTLAEVPSDQLNGNSQLITLYLKAVGCFTKADCLISRLGETHRDQAAQRQQAASDNQEYWQAQGVKYTRQLMQLSPTATVELI